MSVSHVDIFKKFLSEKTGLVLTFDTFRFICEMKGLNPYLLMRKSIALRRIRLTRAAWLTFVESLRVPRLGC